MRSFCLRLVYNCGASIGKCDAKLASIRPRQKRELQGELQEKEPRAQSKCANDKSVFMTRLPHFCMPSQDSPPGDLSRSDKASSGKCHAGLCVSFAALASGMACLSLWVLRRCFIAAPGAPEERAEPSATEARCSVHACIRSKPTPHATSSLHEVAPTDGY